jgi:hypothetical protein
MKYLWGKLRMHVKSKSKILDFIKVSQSKAEEKRLEGINDEDDVDEEEDRGQRNKKKTCQEMLIIHPQKSNFKVFWDTCMAVILAVNLLFIPFTMAFDTKMLLEKNRVMEFVFDIFFSFNILLNFFTAF